MLTKHFRPLSKEQLDSKNQPASMIDQLLQSPNNASPLLNVEKDEKKQIGKLKEVI